MKKIIISALVSMQIITSQAQDNLITKTDKNGLEYKVSINDPLDARIYTLDNGLKVYLSPYNASPRIQTFVAVKAGSKMDPSTATGLAHYLEHIMFKGTSKIGTTNWAKEEPLLDTIETLFEKHRNTNDPEERKRIYHQIDSISAEAAKYAIANEYDKLVSSIGATGTNAYTSFEQTVYVNDIPTNSLEKWATIEAERFSEVVPRLFHTELEAVYEEKNMGMDSDQRKVWEALLDALFTEHQYGTQTTIGTIEHLKSPSITEIKKYFHKYYVPGNMAVCLSGDFNPDEAIITLKNTFGKWQKEPEPEKFDVASEQPITAVKEVKVMGPSAESIMVGFRFPGVNTDAALKMELTSMILANSQAGLIDLNLNQKQKVLGAYSYSLPLKDYSMHILAAGPKEGQDLDEVKELLLSQIELIKKGAFSDELIEAIVNDYKVSQLKEYESNRSRANAFVSSFVYDTPWNIYTNKIERLKKITKEDIVAFANENYKDNNYVVVKKLTGEDTTIQKVEKPIITPIQVNRDTHSEFFTSIVEMKSEPIKPVFIDFEKEINKTELESGVNVFHYPNVENDLFELYYIFDFGKDDDLELALAIQYLNFIGNNKLSASELKQEFYRLGCTFSVKTSDEQMYVQLKGLKENMLEAIKLLENQIKNAQPEAEAYSEMVNRILKSRKDAKLNKDVILKQGLVSYAKYGPKSSFTNNLTEEELKAIQPEQLTDRINAMFKYRHRVYYYGPESPEGIAKILNKEHNSSKKDLTEHATIDFPAKEITKDEVLFVNYDMVQSEIIIMSKSDEFKASILPETQLYNEYFGGGMGSIVFQDLRESKALAYSTRSYYQTANRKEKPNYSISYIGTQADKTETAIIEMEKLIDSIPYSETLFNNAKNAIRQKLESQRILRSSVLFTYEKNRKLGIEGDIRKDIYQKLPGLSFEDIVAFKDQYISGQPRKILIIGSKENLSEEMLTQFGEYTEVTLEEIFGY